MSEPHPLVHQLRFTRAEFLRGVRGVPADGRPAAAGADELHQLERRPPRLAGAALLPDPRARGRRRSRTSQEQFAVGAPGSTPELEEVLSAWRSITREADPWLDALTSARLLEHPVTHGRPIGVTFGNLVQRLIYHYWYHTGENQAIRQQLGHERLPQFVGNIDDEAPYRPEPALARARSQTLRAPTCAPCDRAVCAARGRAAPGRNPYVANQ